MQYIWLIPLLPGHRRRHQRPGRHPLVLAADGRRWSPCATMTAALGAVARGVLAAARPAAPTRAPTTSIVADWIPADSAADRTTASARFQVPWGFRLDPLSGMMLLVVTGIGTLIHVYSTAYMADEPRGGVARFFCYLNLFCFFMLMLVLGNNFLVMFVGWEGRRALLVSADRLLVREEERRGRRQEGVHHQPHRRLGLHPRRCS